MKKTVTMVDPPSGWMYGFPKIIPDDVEGDVRPWLVENGYPQSEIDKMPNHFYCRFWETEVDVDDKKK